MMKKILLFTFFSLWILGAKAQNARIVVQYSSNFEALKGATSFLVVNDTEAFFFFTKATGNSYERMVTHDFKGVSSMFIFNYDINAQLLYQPIAFSSNLSGVNQRISQENFSGPEWTLTNDSKKILGYNCKVATASFRGREYKAWFTTELPTSAFPWKLKGLPGLILAYEDDSGLLFGEATAVILNSNLPMPIKFSEFFAEHKAEAVDYRIVVKAQNQYFNELSTRRIADLPVGTQVMKANPRGMSLEKNFEWESEWDKR